jgi:hypothetical protein
MARRILFGSAVLLIAAGAFLLGFLLRPGAGERLLVPSGTSSEPESAVTTLLEEVEGLREENGRLRALLSASDERANPSNGDRTGAAEEPSVYEKWRDDYLIAVRKEEKEEIERRMAAMDPHPGKRLIDEIRSATDEGRKVELIRLLAGVGGEDALRFLQGALGRAAEVEVRRAVLQALERLPDPSSIFVLVSAYPGEEDRLCRHYVFAALGTIDDIRAWRALVDLYRNTDSRDLRYGILAAFVRRENLDAEIVRFLEEAALETDDTALKGLALQAVTAFGDATSLPALERILRRDDSEIWRVVIENARSKIRARIEGGDGPK